MARNPSVFEVAYRRSKSVTTAMNALRFVVEYGRACHDCEQVLNIAQFAQHIGIAHSLAYRREKAFNLCFPLDEPLTLWEFARPFLEASSFAAEHPRAQAFYVGTLSWLPGESGVTA